MFNNELMADVHFIVGPPGASKKVPAHKVGAERGSLRSRGFRVSVLLVPAAMRARGGRRERSGAERRGAEALSVFCSTCWQWAAPSSTLCFTAISPRSNPKSISQMWNPQPS